MAAKSDTGVKGFFADYEKKRAVPNTSPLSLEDTEPRESTMSKKTARGEKTANRRARTGRPPGLRNGSRSAKAKATMHIDVTLMDFYRDWSWEERCNLGQLIERAMLAYKESRKPATSSGAGD